MATQLIFVLTFAAIFLGPISALRVERCQQEGEGCARNVSSIPPCCPNAVCQYTDPTFGFCRAKQGSNGSPYPASPTRQNRSLDGSEQGDPFRSSAMFDPPAPPPVPIPPNPPFMEVDNPTKTTTEEPPAKPHQWPIKRGYIPFHINSQYDESYYGPRYRLLAEKAIRAINSIMEGCKGPDFLRPSGPKDLHPILEIIIKDSQLQPGQCVPEDGFSEQIGYVPWPKPSWENKFNPRNPNIIQADVRSFVHHKDYVVETLFLHETLHSVFNIKHEHTRRDRDQYIVTKEDRLRCQVPDLPTYYTIDYTASMAYPYDLVSVMASNFTDNAANEIDHTMELRSGIPSYWDIGPQPSGLTFFDAQKMLDFYGCVNENPISINTTRRTVYLADWKISCTGKKITLRYKKTGRAAADFHAMMNECLHVTETEHAVLANLDIDHSIGSRGICTVIYKVNRNGCSYQAVESKGRFSGIVMRTSRVMRTFESKALENNSVQKSLELKDLIAASSQSKVTAENCHQLCHVMPGLCVAASVVNGQHCTLHEQLKEPIHFRRDARATTYIVSDWENDESYNPLV
ncbi:uncharacterized protein LOC129583122 [Paramacrobiotus metropolitanus]|uniref:uncharacterized protein LOC129583122 n=1 Tax=Paramacrobiotus metropolitanus TaxID=2943436 RepID=UPI002445EBFC|nr:uncharacterized protein LOC129583122 [Paramacrobiotus metropolitanus]